MDGLDDILVGYLVAAGIAGAYGRRHLPPTLAGVFTLAGSAVFGPALGIASMIVRAEMRRVRNERNR